MPPKGYKKPVATPENSDAENVEAPPKRRPGRPRKVVETAPTEAASPAAAATAPAAAAVSAPTAVPVRAAEPARAEPVGGARGNGAAVGESPRSGQTGPPTAYGNGEAGDVGSAAVRNSYEATGASAGGAYGEPDAGGRSDTRQDASREIRGLEGPPRGVESRGLRFRGRDGRAEVRGREVRGNEGRSNEARGNDRGFRPRHENGRTEEAGGFAGRLAGRENSGGRHEGPRQDNRNFERDLPRRPNDLDFNALDDKTSDELVVLATELAIEGADSLSKADLVYRILEAQAYAAGNQFKHGILEILPDGKGFLRTEGYLPGNEDVYVSQSQIKRFNLRTGDMVSGSVRAPKEMERYYGLLRVEATNGLSPDTTRTRKEFEKLTPIFPDDKFRLETTQENITARIIDLVSPIGKGQRGLIVAPPKAGKTTLIKNIANSIMANHPGVYLIVLLIDERPEEVTDISRSVRGEVVASTFDEMPDNHVRVADMVLEKAKRMVEQKKDVIILLDSLTRLSRASNLVVAPSGRTMSGGLDPAAMHKPKRLFGAARNIEEGGSLTILATALVDTGSRMDDYIFEEFKGTGNLDLVLDRSLFDQRIFPAIDINKSGTRRDDLLLSKEDLATVFHLRRTLASLDNDKAITLLIDRLRNTKSNEDFMQVVQKSARQTGSQ